METLSGRGSKDILALAEVEPDVTQGDEAEPGLAG